MAVVLITAATLADISRCLSVMAFQWLRMHEVHGCKFIEWHLPFTVLEVEEKIGYKVAQNGRMIR
jgi:hypothetical protein